MIGKVGKMTLAERVAFNRLQKKSLSMFFRCWFWALTGIGIREIIK